MLEGFKVLNAKNAALHHGTDSIFLHVTLRWNQLSGPFDIYLDGGISWIKNHKSLTSVLTDFKLSRPMCSQRTFLDVVIKLLGNDSLMPIRPA